MIGLREEREREREMLSERVERESRERERESGRPSESRPELLTALPYLPTSEDRTQCSLLNTRQRSHK